MLTLLNANVFDGARMLSGAFNVSIENGRIRQLAPATGSTGQDVSSGDVVDLKGMTLMPGLITCHLHPEFYRFSLAMGQAGERPGKELPPGVLMAIGVRTCKVLLESGFTGYIGAASAHNIDAQLQMAIAEGIIPGPRIRACGHHIGTTADLNDSPLWWKSYTTPGIDVFADGPEDLRKLVREEVRCGAQTIKIFTSSGRGFNGRAMRNMTRDEIAAVVNAAHDLGARVRAHVCDREMILECVELGVDIIDHGDEIDERCIEAMIAKGTFWVPSLTYPKILLDLGWDADGSIRRQFDNAVAMLPVAQEAGVQILIGDDYSGVFRDVLEDDPLDHQTGCYGREFEFYSSIEGLDSESILSWGTKNAGNLLVDKPGELGVIAVGALADLIVIDGNPVNEPSILAKPDAHLKAVIQEGTISNSRLEAL